MKNTDQELIWNAYRYARRKQGAELLHTHPLAESVWVQGFQLAGDSAALRALTVRALLLWAAEKTRPSEALEWRAYRWRTYCILRHYYLDGDSAELWIERFNIQEVTFWVSARKAIERVVPIVQAAEIGKYAEQQRVAAELRYTACDADGQRWLRLLALFDTPLSSADASRYFPELNDVSLSSLKRLNVIEEHATGVQLHTALRPYVETQQQSVERQRWHVAASQQAVAHKQPLVACQHLLDAQQPVAAAELLVANEDYALSASETARTLLTQVETTVLPNDLWADICLLTGRIAERTENLATAQKAYRRAVVAVDPFRKATGYFRLAQLSRRIDLDAAIHHFQRCIDLLDRLFTQPAQMLLAQANLKRAMIFLQERVDLERAKKDLETAQIILKQYPDFSLEADLHNRWALYYHCKQNPIAEEPHRWRAWQLAYEGEDAEQIADATHNLGLVYARLARYERAIVHLEEAYQLAVDESLQQTAGLCQRSLGVCYFELKNFVRAQTHYETAYQEFKELGTSRWQATICYDLAEVLSIQANYGQARLYYLEGRLLSEHMGFEHLVSLFEGLVETWHELSCELSNHQQIILEYVRSAGRVNRAECQQLIQRKPRQATRLLNSLVEMGLLKRCGQARATHYQLTINTVN